MVLPKFSAARVGNVRLLPALIATGSVVFALKAATLAAAAAEAAEAPAADASADGHAEPAKAAAPAGAAGATQCAVPSFAEQAGLSATEVEVLQSLGARRSALDARETDISTQASLVEASQKRVDERLAELKRVQTAVEQILGKLDEEQNARINGLVQVYSKMKPKEAARIFEGLDSNVLLEVSSRMKQATLAPIMGAMSPEAARKLTKAIADSKKVPDDVLTKTGAAAAAGGGKPG